MSQVAYQAGAYFGFCSMKSISTPPLDKMLVYWRVTPSIIHLGGERHCESLVSCQEHDDVPGRTGTRTSWSRDKYINPVTTAPPPDVSCKDFQQVMCKWNYNSQCNVIRFLKFAYTLSILEGKHFLLLKLNFRCSSKLTRSAVET